MLENFPNRNYIESIINRQWLTECNFNNVKGKGFKFLISFIMHSLNFMWLTLQSHKYFLSMCLFITACILLPFFIVRRFYLKGYSLTILSQSSFIVKSFSFYSSYPSFFLFLILDPSKQDIVTKRLFFFEKWVTNKGILRPISTNNFIAMWTLIM